MTNNKRSILWHYISTKLRFFSSRNQLNSWQQLQFKRFKKRVLINSPFYKPYVDMELSCFPIIDKAQYMEHFAAINTVNIEKDEAMNLAIKAEQNRDFSPMINDITVGLSSGTSGSRGVFLVSQKERNQWAGTIIAKLLPKAIWKSQKIAFFLRANSNLYQSVGSRSIQFMYFDLLHSIEEHIGKLNQFQPNIIVAPASVLLLLSKHLNQELLIKPIKLISVAEVLTNNDQNFIEQQFKQKVHQIYQATEGLLGCTCEYGHIHLNEDIVIIEKAWIDEKSGRFSPIITDFRRETQPIVRYKLDDILVLDDSPCCCGSCFMKIKQIEGRCDDILLLPSEDETLKNVYPDFIRNTLISCDARIENYRVQQISFDTINIAIEPFDDSININIKQALDALFDKLQLKTPFYSFLPYKPPVMGSKLRRVFRSFEL